MSAFGGKAVAHRLPNEGLLAARSRRCGLISTVYFPEQDQRVNSLVGGWLLRLAHEPYASIDLDPSAPDYTGYLVET